MSARILIVDDEEIICRSCERILGEDGYQLKSIQDSSEALKLIGEERFSVSPIHGETRFSAMEAWDEEEDVSDDEDEDEEEWDDEEDLDDEAWDEDAAEEEDRASCRCANGLTPCPPGAAAKALSGERGAS